MDEVWFVIDTDRWGAKIPELRSCCQTHFKWEIAQSNPCFEVWLYYHLFDDKVTFPWMETCKEWKNFLVSQIPGGFDSRKHPIYVEKAMDNAKRHFSETGGAPNIGSTEVFKLAECIQTFCRWKIENILNKL